MDPRIVSQNIELSPEAKAILAQEGLLFGQEFVPDQQQAFAEILRRLGTPGATTPATMGARQASGAARAATRTAGQAYGLPGRTVGTVDRTLQSNEPDILSALQALFEHLGTQQSTLIDPRFAQYLAPRIDSSPPERSTAEAIVPALVAGAQVASRFV